MLLPDRKKRKYCLLLLLIPGKSPFSLSSFSATNFYRCACARSLSCLLLHSMLPLFILLQLPCSSGYSMWHRAELREVRASPSCPVCRSSSSRSGRAPTHQPRGRPISQTPVLPVDSILPRHRPRMYHCPLFVLLRRPPRLRRLLRPLRQWPRASIPEQAMRVEEA